MEVLIQDGKCAAFLIEFEEGDFDVSASFNVYEVTAWTMENEVSEKELYLKGCIKWDGCSHIWFGDKDGYLHLCGKRFFEWHKRVMDAIWDAATKRIEHFDKDIAS